MSTADGQVHLSIADGIAAIVFDRPQAHNAMTWTMYEALAAHCDRLAVDPSIKVVTMRGAGGKAFIAGTDIEQFRTFENGDDGIRYEHGIDAGIDRIERLPMPVVAILEGWVVGGGLAIASACDLRIATPQTRFAVPIARTLGNCLSTANTARVVAGFGPGLAKRLLLLADNVDANEARACGFVAQIAEPDAIDGAATAMCERLAGHAPLTMRAAKEAIRRIGTSRLPDTSDLVSACYGSNDFREGVAAFVEKRKPRWSGT